MDLKQLGERIQQMRDHNGWSQFRAAGFCDLSASHYSAIEDGRVNINFETLMKIADGYQVPVAQLLYEKDQSVNMPYDQDTSTVIAMMQRMSNEDRSDARKLVQVIYDRKR